MLRPPGALGHRRRLLQTQVACCPWIGASLAERHRAGSGITGAQAAAVAGRWASGTESIGALQLKPAQPQLLASRCSAAGGRLGAQSSVRPPTASGPQHASPPTSSHWEERRARTALRAQPVTAQIWPSFQLERQPPPAGGLLIHRRGGAAAISISIVETVHFITTATGAP